MSFQWRVGLQAKSKQRIGNTEDILSVIDEISIQIRDSFKKITRI
jgi:hypothetical protein